MTLNRFLFAVGVACACFATGLDGRPHAPSGRRVLGNDCDRVAIIAADGRVEWQYDSRYDGHDVWLLPGGNVLLAAGPTRVVEVTPAKEVVWSYEAKPKAGYSGRVEVHAFQRLDDGVT